MEANKGEAQKCIDLAEKYLMEGNSDKALKFFHKAESLYPTTEAKCISTAVLIMIALLMTEF